MQTLARRPKMLQCCTSYFFPGVVMLICLGAIVAACLVTKQSSDEVSQSSQAMVTAMMRRGYMSNLLAFTLRASLEKRGFVITGDELYVNRYNAAIERGQ